MAPHARNPTEHPATTRITRMHRFNRHTIRYDTSEVEEPNQDFCVVTATYRDKFVKVDITGQGGASHLSRSLHPQMKISMPTDALTKNWPIVVDMN